MALLIVALFLVLPFAELAVIVAAAGSFGLGPTFVALILFSVVGGWLMKREGWAVWRRANEELATGRIPARELIDGAMILGGGALLLTPGFITDFVGLMLLLPPVRAVVRPIALRALARGAKRSAGSARITGIWSGAGADLGGFGGPFDAAFADVDVTVKERPTGSAHVIRVDPLGPDDGPRALDPGS